MKIRAVLVRVEHEAVAQDRGSVARPKPCEIASQALVECTQVFGPEVVHERAQPGLIEIERAGGLAFDLGQAEGAKLALAPDRFQAAEQLCWSQSEAVRPDLLPAGWGSDLQHAADVEDDGLKRHREMVAEPAFVVSLASGGSILAPPATTAPRRPMAQGSAHTCLVCLRTADPSRSDGRHRRAARAHAVRRLFCPQRQSPRFLAARPSALRPRSLRLQRTGIRNPAMSPGEFASWTGWERSCPYSGQTSPGIRETLDGCGGRECSDDRSTVAASHVERAQTANRRWPQSP
jgi:hypothetical protein